VDVLENAEELLMLIDVPGVDESGLDIRLEGGQLDIEAKQAVTEGRTFPGSPSSTPAPSACRPRWMTPRWRPS